MKNRKAFNFYKSFDGVMQELTLQQKGKLIEALLNVQFFRVYIDDISFNDKILSICWKSIEHSILQQLVGYCNKQKSTYNREFLGGTEGGCLGGTEGGCLQGEGQGKGKGEGKGEGEEQGQGEVVETMDKYKDINKEVWKEWKQHRKEIKKTLTKSTMTKQLNFLLARINTHEAIINQSIQNGWAGLFEIKKNKSNQHNESAYSNNIFDVLENV